MKTCIKFSMIAMIFLFIQATVTAQIMYGKITYERKTNLFKKFKDENLKEWIREEEKNKIDVFELYFNDSISVFKPQDSELKERNSWATRKDIVYKNFKTKDQLSVKEVWGEKFMVEDSMPCRKWKITGSKRNIAGYDCRKAIFYINDSTPIFAWYTNDIVPSIGPESFSDLPGAILGLATEDGGVIYFAKSVETVNPGMKELIPVKGKNKVYSSTEMKTKLLKEFGKSPWGKAMIKDMFSW
jgi:GLPGLI family protein